MHKKHKTYAVQHEPRIIMTTGQSVSTCSLTGINTIVVNMRTVKDFKAIINKAHSLIS